MNYLDQEGVMAHRTKQLEVNCMSEHGGCCGARQMSLLGGRQSELALEAMRGGGDNPNGADNPPALPAHLHPTGTL